MAAGLYFLLENHLMDSASIRGTETSRRQKNQTGRRGAGPSQKKSGANTHTQKSTSDDELFAAETAAPDDGLMGFRRRAERWTVCFDAAPTLSSSSGG